MVSERSSSTSSFCQSCTCFRATSFPIAKPQSTVPSGSRGHGLRPASQAALVRTRDVLPDCSCYFAAGVTAERPWITVKGAYIAAGDRFRRVVVDTPLNSEPDRENIFVTLRPKPFLDSTAGHLNFLEPAPGV